MRMSSFVALGAVLASTPALAQVQPKAQPKPHQHEQHRELAPHVHGAGTLNIAIDGATVTMELNAPAHDIVGFEHKPNNAAQRRAIDTAKRQLSRPLALFVVPPAAGCIVKSAEVKFDTGEAKTAPAKAAPAKPAAEPKPEAAEAKHADFDADYVLTCKAPDKVQSIQFPYFKAFRGAEKLTVTIVGASQQRYEVAASAPTIILK
jgi:hypothetical protein